MFLRIIGQSLKVRYKRILLAIAAVLMGASVAAALLNVYFSLNDKVGRELKNYGANIVVNPKNNALQLEMDGVNYTPVAERQYLDEAEIYKVKKIFWKYNIVGFNPYLDTVVQVQGQNVTLTGTWFDKEIAVPQEAYKTVAAGMKTVAPWWQVEGSSIAADDRQHVIMGAALAERFRVKPGDNIEFTYNQQRRTMQVAGIVNTGGAEDSQIYANLAVVQALLGLPNKYSQLKVSALITPDDALAKRNPETMTAKEYERWYCTPYMDSITLQIDEVLKNGQAKPIQQIAQAENKFLAKMNLLMLLVTVMALLAAALGVMTTMTTTVLERRKEIGILKAIGVEIQQVALLFLGEAAAIGLVGGIGGYAAGIGLAKFIGQSVFNAQITPDIQVLPLTISIAIAVALLGSSLPVWRATRIEPVVVLRGE
ncbi:ABC transporter permease [Sporomusa sphaeroides]|uniref:ABC transporter permease n=1 Tax=Sporomusa sphaeroides TaxID=47679 RepID=UPI002C8AA26F|nr:ABC transporter permease [Sporomusa sphaeroides]HML35156.1 ABC transporter permease [Sporomusa sphaeroides]